MSLLDGILSQLDQDELIEKLGKSVNANPDQVKKLVQVGMPSLVQALNKNAKSPEGAASLAKALDQHKDDKVDDLADFLKNVDTKDGAKILQHVLGSKTNAVEKNLSLQTGLQGNQVGALLSMLAPLLMGSLGQQKKRQGVDTSGLGGLLGGLLGGSGSDNLLGGLSGLLDSDKDGDMMDDVGDLLGGFFKK